MAKIRLEFEKFKLEIEAEPHEMPQISSHVNRQLSGLIDPAANLASGQPLRRQISASVVEPSTGSATQNGNGNGSSQNTKDKKRTSSSRRGAAPVDYLHDTEKWGFPSQDLSTAEKAMYVLYVVEHTTGVTELSAGTIAATFNKHYKQAGSVRPSNVSKYLGEAKAKEKPALVDENTTADPFTWFLTTEGRRRAEQLVIQAKGLNGAVGGA